MTSRGAIKTGRRADGQTGMVRAVSFRAHDDSKCREAARGGGGASAATYLLPGRRHTLSKGRTSCRGCGGGDDRCRRGGRSGAAGRRLRGRGVGGARGQDTASGSAMLPAARRAPRASGLRQWDALGPGHGDADGIRPISSELMPNRITGARVTRAGSMRHVSLMILQYSIFLIALQPACCKI